MVIHRAIQNSNDDDGHPRFELRPFWVEHPSDITECVRVCNEESNQVRKWRLNNTRTPPASFWEEPWPKTWEEPWQKRRGGKRHLTLEERISKKITWLLRHCTDFRQNNLNAEGFATLNSVITYLGLLRIATIMVIHRAIQNSNDDDGHPRFELRPFWVEHPSDITECVRVCNEESNQVRKWRLNNTRTPPASFWEEPWPETWEEPWQKYSQEESEQETSWHKTEQEKYHEERHDNWQKESQEDWQEKPLHKTWQEGSWQEESGKEGSWQERHDNWKQSWREGPGQEGSWQKEWQQTWQEGSGKEEWPKKSWQGKRQKPWQEQWGKEKTWENKDEDQDLSWKVEADPCWID